LFTVFQFVADFHRDCGHRFGLAAPIGALAFLAELAMADAISPTRSRHFLSSCVPIAFNRTAGPPLLPASIRLTPKAVRLLHFARVA
jgi:hypothetical protein